VMAPAALSLLAVTFTHGKDRATAQGARLGCRPQIGHMRT
jgi:hypothetical protein